MRVEIRLDGQLSEPYAVLYAPRLSEELERLARRLSDERDMPIAGFNDGQARLIDPEEIRYLYCQGARVYAHTIHGDYALRLRLYELEQRLDPARFVRVSNGEIVNLKKVKRLDLSRAGTLSMEIEGGARVYASRRQISKIRKRLGI